MPLYNLSAPTVEISIVPLTPETFAPFGTVIQPPIHSSSRLPGPPDLPSNAVPANQGTALKLSGIADLQNFYSIIGAPSGVPASPAMSMFLCAPRKLRKGRYFDIRLLERHPFTSQTFVPLGLGTAADEDRTYLIIVAPNLAASCGLVGEGWMPDLRRVRAFVARGGQAVTYARGTWHAPMVVLGASNLAFVVVQWSNGTGWEDCEECTIEQGLSVVIGKDAVGERVRAHL